MLEVLVCGTGGGWRFEEISLGFVRPHNRRLMFGVVFREKRSPYHISQHVIKTVKAEQEPDE